MEWNRNLPFDCITMMLCVVLINEGLFFFLPSRMNDELYLFKKSKKGSRWVD